MSGWRISNIPKATGEDTGYRVIRGGGMGGALTVHATEIPDLIRALTVTHDQWIDEELLRTHPHLDLTWPPPDGLPLVEQVFDGDELAAYTWRIRYPDGNTGRVPSLTVALRAAGQEVARGRP